MSQSELLANFNPFATHPFTNSSGVMPPPPQPSLYGAQPGTAATYPQIPTSDIPLARFSNARPPSVSSSRSPQRTPSRSPPLAAPQSRMRAPRAVFERADSEPELEAVLRKRTMPPVIPPVASTASAPKA